MEGALFVGLDAHKRSIVATVIDAEGERRDQAELGSSDAELRAYLARLSGSV